MKFSGRWLVRGGSLVVALGFFLPAFTVSCNSVPIGTFSLSSLARGLQEISQYTGGNVYAVPVLYLVLLAALAALGISFIPPANKGSNTMLALGQLACIGLSALVMIGSLSSVYSQVSSSNQQVGAFGQMLGLDAGKMFTTSPEFGLFVLILGYLLAGVGTLMQLGETPSPGAVSPRGQPTLRSASPMSPLPPNYAPPPPAAVPARAPQIIVVSGEAPRALPLIDNFLIGRSRQCHLVLSDPRVSRVHAAIRFAQGSWFIQDKESSQGTFVNGQRVAASRINPGDQITVGSVTLTIRQ